MPLIQNQEIRDTLNRLREGMLEYLKSDSANYSEADIDACSAILVSHIEAIEKATDRALATDLVKGTVLRLNELNERAGADLIETSQREDICEIIIKAGALKGFNSADEDITEEWRDW